MLFQCKKHSRKKMKTMSKFINRRNFLKSAAPLIAAPALLSNSKLFAASNDKLIPSNPPLEVLHDGILTAPNWGHLGRGAYTCVGSSFGDAVAPTFWEGTLSSPKTLQRIELVTSALYEPSKGVYLPLNMSDFGSAAFPIFFHIWNENIQTFCSAPFAGFGTIGVPNFGSTTVPITTYTYENQIFGDYLIGWDNLNMSLPANVPLKMSIQFEVFDPSRPGQVVGLYGSSVPGPHITDSELYKGTICYTIAEPSMASRISVSNVITAANVEISGCIVNQSGRGIPRARLTLQNTNTNEIFSAISNSFGYFKFNEQPIGNFYILSVNAKGQTFTPNTQAFELLDNVTNLEFVGTSF